MEPIERYRGSMLGLAVGDALGAPVEGLKAGHIRQLYGEVRGYVDAGVAWKDKPHRWVMPGLYTDDTQQALALADTLVKCRGFDEAYFIKLLCELAREDTGGPFGAHRGAGSNFRATVRALMDGAKPERAAVTSAGIGAMMRSAPAGLYFAGDEERVLDAAARQGLVTHADPRGVVMGAVAAFAVARAAEGAWDKMDAGARLRELAAAAERAEKFVERQYVHRFAVAALGRMGMAARGMALLPRLVELPEDKMAFNQIVSEANRQFPEHKITEPGQGFVMAAGLSALFIAAAAKDFEDAVGKAVHLGKDTDTMGVIVGAIAGARFGEGAIPGKWIAGLMNAEQVGMRGEALNSRDGSGLPMKPLAAMEAELTRKEVAARQELIERLAARADKRPPAKRKAPAKSPAPPVAVAPPEMQEVIKRERQKKRQKPSRDKAPWKK